MNGYPSFYPRIALVAPSPGLSVRLKQKEKEAIDFPKLEFNQLRNHYTLTLNKTASFIATCLALNHSAVLL